MHSLNNNNTKYLLNTNDGFKEAKKRLVKKMNLGDPKDEGLNNYIRRQKLKVEAWRNQHI